MLRPEAIKLEENIGKGLLDIDLGNGFLDIDLGNGFLDMTLKAQATEAKISK